MTADLELQGLGETDALLKTSERPKKRALAIQIVALCGAAALAGAALASRAGKHDVAVTGLARTSAPAEGVVCPQIWEPVCGKDGKTYPNPCMAGAMTFTTGACQEAPPATANETLPTNESLPVAVPDLKYTTTNDDQIPPTDDLDDFGGCGCSVQTCCETLAAGEMYLGCQPIFEKGGDSGEICNQVRSGILDGDMSVCDVPELANGPAQLTATIVDESCGKMWNTDDTCIPVKKNQYFWWNIAIAPDTCETFFFPAAGLGISVNSRCDDWMSDMALAYNICEQGMEPWCGEQLGNSTIFTPSPTSQNDDEFKTLPNNCPPPFGKSGPTGLIEYDDNTPGSIGLCQPVNEKQSVVFTVNGKWPCEPGTPKPTITAAPTPQTPHHHHHDGAVADARDAALGSLVVAALTAAVLA